MTVGSRALTNECAALGPQAKQAIHESHVSQTEFASFSVASWIVMANETLPGNKKVRTEAGEVRRELLNQDTTGFQVPR
jgi:hypothetical protein